VRTDKTYQERRRKKKGRKGQKEKAKQKMPTKSKRERERQSPEKKTKKVKERESLVEFAKTTIMCFMLTHWYPYNNNCALP